MGVPKLVIGVGGVWRHFRNAVCQHSATSEADADTAAPRRAYRWLLTQPSTDSLRGLCRAALSARRFVET